MSRCFEQFQGIQDCHQTRIIKSVPRDSLLLFSPFLLSIVKDIGVLDDVTNLHHPGLSVRSVFHLRYIVSQGFTNIPSNITSIKQELLDLPEILQVDLCNQNLDFYPIKEERKWWLLVNILMNLKDENIAGESSLQTSSRAYRGDR